MNVSSLHTFAKYLDQPLLLRRLNSATPILLPLAGAGYVAYETLRAPADERRKRFIKIGSVMAATVAAALFATRKFAVLEPHNAVRAAKTVRDLLTKQKITVSSALDALLNKSKTRILKPSEVGQLYKHFAPLGKAQQSKLINIIIPPPVNEGAAKMFREIWNLSMLGFFPVVGGVLGGVLGNVLNGDRWKKEFKNQAKEGIYQYLSNIVLCNVGAALCLFGLEKTPFGKNKLARVASMMVGIAAFGVIGGSSIANFFGKNFFNPLFDKGFSQTFGELKQNVSKHGVGSLFKNLNDERHPELLDVGLHIDDVATVGVLAGLKWIVPALAFLYSVSGYRAGIGYRNGTDTQPKAVLRKTANFSGENDSQNAGPNLEALFAQLAQASDPLEMETANTRKTQARPHSLQQSWGIPAFMPSSAWVASSNTSFSQPTLGAFSPLPTWSPAFYGSYGQPYTLPSARSPWA